MRQQPMEHRVPQFVITTVVGAGNPGFSGDGGPATEASIGHPTAVAMDSLGTLFIADVYNQRIRAVDPTGVIRTVMGTGRSGSQEQDLPAIETNLASAYGIAADAEDNLYVLDRVHTRIFRFGQDGIARRIAGTGENGFAGDGGPAVEALLRNPCHLAVGADGTLFIADTGNNCVRAVTPDGIIRTVVGTGEAGYDGDGGAAVDARLSGPAALAIDAAGVLYVADFANHCIRSITPDGIIRTIAGTGEPEYNGDGQPATECSIGEPCGVAVDSSGYVYVADQINCRIRVVTPAGIMHTVAGTGIEGYDGDGGPAEDARISNPDIIAFDRTGRDLYVPDYANAVIRKLTRVDRR